MVIWKFLKNTFVKFMQELVSKGDFWVGLMQISHKNPTRALDAMYQLHALEWWLPELQSTKCLINTQIWSLDSVVARVGSPFARVGSPWTRIEALLQRFWRNQPCHKEWYSGCWSWNLEVLKWEQSTLPFRHNFWRNQPHLQKFLFFVCASMCV